MSFIRTTRWSAFGRARNEFGHKVHGEVACQFGRAVHEQPAAANVIRQREQPGDSVLEERGAKPKSLVVGVGSETGEQGDRLRVAPGTLPQPGWGRLSRELRRAPAGEGDHLLPADVGDDEHLRRPGAGRLAGMAPQPVGLLGGSTVEPGDVVVSEGSGAW